MGQANNGSIPVKNDKKSKDLMIFVAPLQHYACVVSIIKGAYQTGLSFIKIFMLKH